MIKCIVNDIKKIQMFLIRARSLTPLNNLYILNGLYVNNTSQLAIIANQAFWHLVYMI